MPLVVLIIKYAIILGNSLDFLYTYVLEGFFLFETLLTEVHLIKLKNKNF